MAIAEVGDDCSRPRRAPRCALLRTPHNRTHPMTASHQSPHRSGARLTVGACETSANARTRLSAAVTAIISEAP